MKASIYCRVSTDIQEKEGTSLDSQKDACLAKARELDLEVPPDCILLEDFTGATLDRPRLKELREWIRAREIDAVIAYAYDRLSREPVDFLILQDEMEKHSVALILVSETLDSTPEGKLILHVKGYAAKLEREKIRERTMRGKKTRVEKLGKLPCGRGVLYGYDYDKEKGINTANANLDIVRMIGLWLIQEHIFLNEVCRRLNERNILAPKGGELWSRGTVGRLMRNSTYAGKTFANRSKAIEVLNNQGKKVTKRIATSDNLIEILNAVDRPAFNSEEWESIQHQLDRNRELSPRKQKREYLLRGMVYCKECGRKHYGVPVHGKRYYRCSGRNKLLTNVNCSMPTENGDWLEKVVWEHFLKELKDPDFLLRVAESKGKSSTTINHLQETINLNKNRLATLDAAETKFLRLYGAGVISEDKLKTECKRIKSEIEYINRDISKAEDTIKRMSNMPSTEDIKSYCKQFYQLLNTFESKHKRAVLEMMQTRVWVEKSQILIEEILNTVNIPYLSKQAEKDDSIVSSPLSQQWLMLQKKTTPFIIPFCIPVLIPVKVGGDNE